MRPSLDGRLQTCRHACCPISGRQTKQVIGTTCSNWPASFDARRARDAKVKAGPKKTHFPAADVADVWSCWSAPRPWSASTRAGVWGRAQLQRGSRRRRAGRGERRRGGCYCGDRGGDERGSSHFALLVGVGAHRVARVVDDLKNGDAGVPSPCAPSRATQL